MKKAKHPLHPCVQSEETPNPCCEKSSLRGVVSVARARRPEPISASHNSVRQPIKLRQTCWTLLEVGAGGASVQNAPNLHPTGTCLTPCHACLDESSLFIRKKDDLLHVMQDYNKMCYVLSHVLIYLLKDIINNIHYINTH